VLTDFLAVVENLDAIRALRTSPILYPLLNGGHILSFSLLFGAIAVYDLAVLRHGTGAAPTAGPALSIARGALVAAAVTGALLFAVRAMHYAENPAFLLKLGLIVLAALNVLMFHRAVGYRGSLPSLSAGLSLVVWAGVIVTGRWIGFV